MTPGFAQMQGDKVGSGIFGAHGRLYRIRIDRHALLAQRGHMIDIHAQLNHWYFLAEARSHWYFLAWARSHWHFLARAWSHRFFLARSEEHTSELPSLMRISFAVFCLKKLK